jgi:hypothetical protein
MARQLNTPTAGVSGGKMGYATDWMGQQLSTPIAIVLGGKTGNYTGQMAQQLNGQTAPMSGGSMAMNSPKLNGNKQSPVWSLYD